MFYTNNEVIKNMSENVTKKNSKKGKQWLLIVGAVVGILLILWGGMEEKKTSDTTKDESEPNAENYIKEVEAEIKRIASGVRGVGGVEVAVTLKGGYRAVYATDRKSTGEGYQNQTVLVGSGASEGAILLGYENPEIGGIGIVCEGGADPVIRERLVFLISAAFGVDTHKIYVVEGDVS